MPGLPVILASKSPSRKALLASAGVACQTRSSRVDERAFVGSDPTQTARLRAQAKALDVAARCPAPSLIIGADQVVHVQGEAFGKPADDLAWFAQLRRLSAQPHDLVTAVCVVASQTGQQWAFEEHTVVHLRSDLRDDELADYIARGEARFCAGGYMVEGRGAWLVDRVHGDWNNVLGLPLFRVLDVLRSAGWGLGDAERP